MGDINVYKKIIEQRLLTTAFQPIVSVKNRKMLGVEALSRGVYNGAPVAPAELFAYAKSSGEILRLERLCRELSLKSFADIKSEMLMFLNFETSLLDTDIAGSGKILNDVQAAGVKPESVVIEVNEDRVKDVGSLKSFISFYRSKGFLIALDDVGAGHSNLNRIAAVMPDIVKIDRTNITDIDKNFYQQEIVGAMVNLSHNTGALTVAEGVETIDEAVACLMLGIDYMQGFYFSKPVSNDEINRIALSGKLEYTAQSFKSRITKEMNDAKLSKAKYSQLLYSVVERLCVCNDDSAVLHDIVAQNKNIECAYLLDESGVQITDTVMNNSLKLKSPALFSPAAKGDSHELKNYYYYAKLFDNDIYMSGDYVSGASGSLCKTISASYTSSDGRKKIICLDIVEK